MAGQACWWGCRRAGECGAVMSVAGLIIGGVAMGTVVKRLYGSVAGAGGPECRPIVSEW